MAKKPHIQVYAREWREKKGLTLEKAADRMGMSVSYLSDLEKGHPKKRWNISHLAALANAYELDDFQDLFRHPDRYDPLLSLVKGLSKEEKATAERVITAMVKRTGADG
jgi:transcriptional regulator with XRE-family HTH domain